MQQILLYSISIYRTFHIKHQRTPFNRLASAKALPAFVLSSYLTLICTKKGPSRNKYSMSPPQLIAVY